MDGIWPLVLPGIIGLFAGLILMRWKSKLDTGQARKQRQREKVSELMQAIDNLRAWDMSRLPFKWEQWLGETPNFADHYPKDPRPLDVSRFQLRNTAFRLAEAVNDDDLRAAALEVIDVQDSLHAAQDTPDVTTAFRAANVAHQDFRRAASEYIRRED